MPNFPELLSAFVLLWAVIDPIGTLPVFIASTKNLSPAERRKVARLAALAAGGILIFFIVVGEVLLRAMGVPLLAFQIAGGLILFLFALTMVFGESKPEGELHAIRSVEDVAIFPLATPSIASPGAMMAAVLLTENASHSIWQQAIVAIMTLLVVGIVYLLMLASAPISRVIGPGGASVVSRVMGLILASIAAANVLEGIKAYFAA